jgi:hypothetical protein
MNDLNSLNLDVFSPSFQQKKNITYEPVIQLNQPQSQSAKPINPAINDLLDSLESVSLKSNSPSFLGLDKQLPEIAKESRLC